MFGIKYNNEFLDIAGDQDGELEANSPLFLIDNVLAEYSSPLTIVYSDKNVRLIGPIFFNPTIRKKAKLNVELYKGDSYRCNATLVIESVGIRRSSQFSNASGYLLTGISSFFSLVKDVLLENIKLGTLQSKNFTTGNPFDSSDGYWQWIHQSWGGNMDWVAAPVRNDNLNDNTDNPTEWMNMMGKGELQDGTTEARNQLVFNKPITPMLKVKIAFKSIFNAYGWTLDDSAMTDAGWQKLLVFSTYSVYAADQFSSFSFYYQNLLPKNVLASSFILAICKRYGWIPICNAEKRVCTMITLRDGDKGNVKDWTAYAEPDIESDFSADEKTFSFKNNFTGNDAVVNDTDINSKDRSLTVDSKFSLPAPSVIYDYSAVFCYRENAWYGIDLDENNHRIWVPLKDNIYNDEIDNATDSVDTDCTTLAMTWSPYSKENGVTYYGLFPFCSQPMYKEAGIRTLFYQGMANEVKADGTSGLQSYPYLSSIRVAPDGTVMNDWSNVFNHTDAAGNNSGIDQYWFAKWLGYMRYTEVKLQNFNLPLYELINYNWNDVILVQNIPHLVLSYIERLSSGGFIQAKLQRLLLTETPEVNITAGVYVKISIENLVFHETYAAPNGYIWQQVYTGELVLRCFSDAAGSIPYAPAGLVVTYQEYSQLGILEYITQGDPQHVTMNTDTVVVNNEVVKNGITQPFNLPFNFKYLLLPDSNYTIIS